MRLSRILTLLILLSAATVAMAVCASAHHDTRLAGFALSPDATRIAAVAKDGSVFWWDVASGKRTQLFECIDLPTFGNIIVFSPDSSTVAVQSSERTMVIFRLSSSSITHTLAGQMESIDGAIFSQDGRRLAVAHRNGVTVWAVNEEMQIASVPDWAGHLAFALNRDGTLLAARGSGEIRLWNMNNKEVARTIKLTDLQNAESLVFANDDRWIVAVVANRLPLKPGQHIIESRRELTLWDAATGEALKTLEGETTELHSPMVVAGNTLLASAYDGTVRVWDLKGGRLTASWKDGGYASADGVFFLRQGDQLGALELWKVGDRDDSFVPFVYRSPVCTSAGPGSYTKKDFDLLWMGSGYGHDQDTMVGFRGYTTTNCSMITITHGHFDSEKAAKQEFLATVKQAPKVLEQGQRGDFGMFYGERALLIFKRSGLPGEYVELALTEGEHFYLLSSTSRELVLKAEKLFWSHKEDEQNSRSGVIGYSSPYNSFCGIPRPHSGH